MKEERRVTLAEVADALGLTKMSVSRALKGKHGVSEATRAKVQAMAQKMGYVPDPAISTAMARMRSRNNGEKDVIAWVSSHGQIAGWKDNPTVSKTYYGALEQAERLGYKLEEFCLNNEDMTPRRLGHILFNRGIHGVILAPLREHGVVEGFPWEHFASVTCGHSLLSPALNRVAADQFQVVQVAWNALTNQGYKRIGLCSSKTDNERVNNLWLSSCLGCQYSMHESNRIPPLITDDWNPQVFRNWFEKHQPDVVLSFPEVYGWLQEVLSGTKKNCGFALLNFDEVESLPGVDHRFEQLGAAAVSVVAEEISSNLRGIPSVRRSVSIECIWQDATSTP